VLAPHERLDGVSERVIWAGAARTGGVTKRWRRGRRLGPQGTRTPQMRS
jgi:hypothetical protein